VQYRLQFFDDRGRPGARAEIEAPTDAHASQQAIARVELGSDWVAVEVWRDGDLVFRYAR
jgi:hypothetical protein